jgi:uncharacterized tellurite resistance protein B-like protein
MDLEMRRKACQLVAGIVVVDDDLDAAEDAFLEKMLRRFGLAAEEREVLFPIMDAKEAASELASFPADAQKEVLDLLIEAVAADGKFADEEREYLSAVCKALELPMDEITARVAKAISG